MNVKEKCLQRVSKITLSLIALIVMMCMFSLTVRAEEEEKAKLSLEEAIRVARSSFEFDAEGLEFSSYYNEYDNGYEETATWRLQWNSKNYDEEYSISVDAIEGRVSSYNLYKDSETSKYSKISKYTEEEAKAKAMDFITQIESDKAQSIKYDEDAYDNAGLATTYNNVYNFRFYRVIGDIPFYDNYISIGVNRDTLEITSYNITWNREETAPIEAKLTDEEVRNIIDSKIGIELMYMIESKNDIILFKQTKDTAETTEEDNKKNARLVYVLKDYGKIIDAVSGEVLSETGYDYKFSTTNSLKEMSAADTAGGSRNIVLSESELKEINNTMKLLSKEEALKKAFEYIDSSYKLESSNINSYEGNYTWAFTLNKMKNDEQVGYERAEVDAVTGEVKSFYIYNYDNKNTTIKYTYEDAKKLADKFLKKIQPEKVEITKVEEDTYKEKSESYTYIYNRLFNGVKAPFNTISITVDGCTGKITRFNMNWYEFNDKSNIKVEDAISITNAYKELYDFSPLELRYVNHIVDNTRTVKLVYGLSYESKVVIDAITKACLDNNLKEIKDEEETTFKDIDGHWAEETIRRLNSYGVIESQEFFNPSNVATQKEVIKMILKGLYSSNVYDNMTDDDYYKLAINKEIIQESEKEMDKQLSRIEVARLVSCSLGYRELVMPTSKSYDASIFASKYYDVKTEDKGTSAVVSTFNIMKGNGRYFNPNNLITKAEVATVVLNMMNR